MMEDTTVPDTISMLSLDYKQDLEKIRAMSSSTSLSIITKNNIRSLESLYMKYTSKCITIDKANFSKVAGELSSLILKRLEDVSGKILGKKLEMREDITGDDDADNTTEYSPPKFKISD